MKEKWPKELPRLSEKEQAVKTDFMEHWHQVLPKRYPAIEKFNHRFSVEYTESQGKVLEIGAGLGEHIGWEDLGLYEEYVALEILPNMAKHIREQYPDVSVIEADCQNNIPYADQYFDKVIAIHMLEHLPDLPKALSEVYRLLKKTGQFVVVIPCEGSMAYSLARKVSAQRIFEKRYNMKYDFFYKSEHINMPAEIETELLKHFKVQKKVFYPFNLPWLFCNLVIGYVLTPISKE